MTGSSSETLQSVGRRSMLLKIMWQEYTREAPARPGFGIAMAALGLFGTMSLAWVMTNRESPMRVESLPNWPIRFSVPDGFTRLDEASELQSPDGQDAKATYVLATSRSVEAVLEVNYEVLDRVDRTLEEVMASRGVVGRDKAVEVSLGTLKGRRVRQMDARGRTVTHLALGLTHEGLVIELQYTGTAHDARGLKRFERVCESIEFQEWSSPRPPAVESSRRPRRSMTGW